MEDAIKIILAIIGSNGLFALIQFFINRRDVKKGEKAEIRKALTRIEKRLDNNERDTCRTTYKRSAYVEINGTAYYSYGATVQVAQGTVIKIYGNAYVLANSIVPSRYRTGVLVGSTAVGDTTDIGSSFTLLYEYTVTNKNVRVYLFDADTDESTEYIRIKEY